MALLCIADIDMFMVEEYLVEIDIVEIEIDIDNSTIS